MTLLSGLPSSYVLSLASPRYVHRDFLHLQDGAEMQPQLGADSPDDLLYESGYGVLGTRSYTTAAMMSYGASGSAGYGMGGGSSHASYGRAAGVAGAEQKVSSLLDVGDEVDVPEVAADVEREVATYTALNPVSIPAGSSGLVPLIRRDLPGRMATVIGRDGGSQTCAFVENDTGLVLQPGVASVYVEGRYRGQLEVFRTQPGQKDTWCFGEDPDVSHSHTIRVTSTPKLVTWENSKLWLHTITTESTTFDVVNDAGQARSIAVEVVLPHKARLVEPTDALHGDGQLRYALLEVPARTTSQRLVVVERGLATAVAVGSASIKALMDTPELPTEYVGHLRPAYDLTLRREAVLAEIQAVQALLAEQQDRSNRVKENLRAVPAGSSGLSAVQRMLEDLASTEREIRRLEDLVKGKTKHVETLNKDIELALTPLTPKEGLR